MFPMQNKNHEIIFVDSGIDNSPSLLASIRNSNAKIVFLNSNTDTLTQIAFALKGQKNLNAIHIISHGASGELDFSNGTLSSENISKYAPLLTSGAS